MPKKKTEPPMIEKSTEPTGPIVADPKTELHGILDRLELFTRNTGAVMVKNQTERGKHASVCFNIMDVLRRARTLLLEI